MARIEKTVFISYRRKDISWALAVYQYLTSQKYDVFFDYTHIPSGDFEQIIVSNIKARAHFVLILTPTALDRCSEPGDWLRREIETAMDEKRNIVPLFFDGFNFGSPNVTEKLTGRLADVKRYNGLDIPSGYFPEAMERLNTRYLNVPLSAVLHPVSTEVKKVVKGEKSAANKALRDQKEDIQELVKPIQEKADRPRQIPAKKATEPPSHVQKEASVDVKTTSLYPYAIGAGVIVLAALVFWGVSSLINKIGEISTPTPTSDRALIPASPSVDIPVSGRCGNKADLAGEIHLYNWHEYIDPAIIDMFKAECGVDVVQTNFSSNEEILAMLQAGGSNYDIIIPSDYMVRIMIDEGLLMPLDYDVIVNIKYMDSLNVHQYFDPDQKYTVPWFWGTSGIAVDTNVVTDYSASWSMMFDPNSPYCGKISMLDDQRETLGAALMYLGYSINDTDPAHLEEAKHLLIEQSKCVKAYDSQTNDDLIISGETVLAHIWTGDALLAGNPKYGGRDGITYVIPEEGCTIWQDNMAIPVNAPNAYTAMVFMNYSQFPEIAAQNANYVGYASPNTAAMSFIDSNMISNQGLYPSSEVKARLQWIEDVGSALELYDSIWTEFKSVVSGT